MTSCILHTHIQRNYSCLYNFNRVKLFEGSRLLNAGIVRCSSNRRFDSTDKSNLSDVVVPVAVKVTSNPDDINVGEEITGTKLKSEDVQIVLTQFYRRSPIKTLSSDHGMDPTLFQKAFASFKAHCLDTPVLEPEIHIIMDEIIRGFRYN